VSTVDDLRRGRDAVAGRSWTAAHDALATADARSPLSAEDLELLATAAYMLGRDEEYLDVVERAHHAHLDDGRPLRAARCGFWIGMHLSIRGEMGRGSGWLGRAKRLVDAEEQDCVEQGYLLMPQAFRTQFEGDGIAAAAIAGRAAAIAQRYGDRDLLALALHTQGHFLVESNRIADGLELLDEAMVAVTSGEVSPIPSGIVYCGAIIGCKHAYEPRRAQEWTEALTRWCEGQPDLVAFTGRCLGHRAEIMLLRGAWSAAVDEARRAAERAGRANNQSAVGSAWCVVGDVERLRGHPDEAAAAYLEASRSGREPQPGLALLRLAQGDVEAAAAMIRRALGETQAIVDRTELLPAFVEIMLACGDLDAARAGCEELEAVASDHPSSVLDAIVAYARGSVELAEEAPAAALPRLRRAWRVWQEVGAPYDAARARVLISAACRALGDRDAADLELREAREAFARLGARTDLAYVEEGAAEHGLTARELEVLRLVATGRTNRSIAAELVLSERTVDRHVSNIFAKLGVGTRTAAAAYAFEHRLVGG
jgi:DNA-binding CsgD family transcriptional regulator